MKVFPVAFCNNQAILKKMFNWVCTIILLFCCTSISAIENQNTHQSELAKELDNCLQAYWGVDPRTVAFINNKFKPLLHNPEKHAVVKEFIALSKKQNIQFPIDKKIQPLPQEDGIYQSPKEHLIVFESPYVRILWGSTQPGVQESFHTHAWKSVMVVITPTTWEIEYPNGKKEVAEYPIGAYELPAGERYLCTNLGKSTDAGLRFEIKD